MDLKEDMQRAIDYIEEHLDDELDYAEIAKQAYSSSYHFQRVFGILCGMTLGEYIRRRRLTRAVGDLLAGEKVLDVAIKYGYETSESFSRAFYRFHGVLPSLVKRGSSAKVFPPMSLNFDLKGDAKMQCSIRERRQMTLVGFGKRFHGVPYGEERLMQEHEFYSTTRGKQWLLLGASTDRETEYAVVTNVGDDGYDFCIAYEMDEWTSEALFDRSVTGVIDMGFKKIVLEKCFCAVFPTQVSKMPISEYTDIRKRIVTEWLPTSDFRLADAPEVTELHWRGDKRFIEITLPIDTMG